MKISLKIGNNTYDLDGATKEEVMDIVEKSLALHATGEAIEKRREEERRKNVPADAKYVIVSKPEDADDPVQYLHQRKGRGLPSYEEKEQAKTFETEPDAEEFLVDNSVFSR